MIRFRRLIALFAVLATIAVGVPLFAIEELPELAAAFEEVGATGTFVMLDPDSGELRGHNPERARLPKIPASTFKIPNTLIALDCGAVASVDEVLPYGGKPQRFPAWERDMSLREAIKVSNVPIYQELARRIGPERMTAGLAKLDYGNGEIGDTVDRFWLDGPLEISAVEQVEFLRRLAVGDLPVSKEAIAAVQEITLLETKDGLALHGKTGFADVTSPDLGWFVGWVQRGGKIYPFALNIDVPDETFIAKRQPVALECLRRLGVW